MSKRAKTYEEEVVESTFFISIILALPLVGVSVFITPLGQIFGGQPQAIPSFADLMLRLFGFHVIVTILLTARHKFNRRQYGMLAKVMLGLDLILPLALILWAYLAVYVLLASGVFILTVPVILAFFGLGRFCGSCLALASMDGFASHMFLRKVRLMSHKSI